ncbi:MAG: DNA polymerase III subunit alpha [Caldilineales bacterium]|nr:DNA polymerase III subunit alpha [Caldilineales bacterium]
MKKMSEGQGYVELHAHSFYSLLDGASSPEKLLDRAAELHMPALALTDHDNLIGAVQFWRKARDRNIHPIIGAEVTLEEPPTSELGNQHLEPGTRHPTQHLTLLADNQTGYANLCRLLTTAHLTPDTTAPDTEPWPGKTEPRLGWETLNQHRQGLICLSGCRHGPIAAPLLAGEPDRAFQNTARLRHIFGPRHLFIELQRHLRPDETNLIRGQLDIARRLDLPIVATNNVHYAQRAESLLQDVLVCIQHLVALDEGQSVLRANNEYYLKAPAEIARLWPYLPDALQNTLVIAERCQVSLDFGGQRLPEFPVPEEHTAFSYLYELCQQGLRRRYQAVSPAVSKQLAYELDVIERSGLAGYFLIVWDVIRFAREKGIRCQGRGSAANSLVAYVLDITPVDPLRFNLLFERFLSADRHTMPDIDIDFAADRREEVIQYVYRRYGPEHTAMVCNINTFRTRSAVRDVARALGVKADMVDAMQRTYRDWREGKAGGAATEREDEAAGGEEIAFWDEEAAALFFDLCEQLQGVPRHLSIHNGGMLISASPLHELVPLERATMPGRVVVQWDKDSVEDAGLIKLDILGLRTLGMVDEIARLVATNTGQTLALDELTLDDPHVYEALCRADAIGAFQVESRAQAQMLPRLQPRCFEDIVVEVAIIRPGPIQGNMVHPYLRRRQGLEAVTYIHPSLESALADTLGVVLFQEQVLRIAMTLAGFSGGEADQLRRAMKRKSPTDAMKELAQRFVAGAMQNGLGHEEAVEIFGQLAGFASYGFCKSHAAAFALLSYQTMWLKHYYPVEFYCALLNHQPMGFYSPAVVMGDARRHGVETLAPDINRSAESCTVEEGNIRLSLGYIKHVGPMARARVLQARQPGPFVDLPDLCQRTRLPQDVITALIRAGALDALAPDRRQLLWHLHSLDYRPQTFDLSTDLDPVTLPDLDEAERMGWHLEMLGMSPGEHPLRLYRARLQEMGVLSSAALARRPDGVVVKVAGQVVVRQRPETAKGHLFITLEDETGLANLIIRPKLYERRRDVLRTAGMLFAVGRLQREGEVASVLVFDVREMDV